MKLKLSNDKINIYSFDNKLNDLKLVDTNCLKKGLFVIFIHFVLK
jgi:hypothetical protein